MKYLLLISTTFLIPLMSHAQTSWLDVTRAKGADCNVQKPCSITQDNSTKKFKFIAYYKTEKNKKHLQSVSILNEGSGKKVEFKEFKNFQALYNDESLPLQLVDLNQDGRMDLAMQASLSARQGPFYYYWIYDPKKEQFVFSSEQIEKLKSISHEHLKGIATGQAYKIGPDKKIGKVAPKKTSKKTK